MQKLKAQKGITLIALIITIIVMLILVGVSVTVALNGGLFSTAKQATDRTQAEKDKEYTLSTGEVEIDGLIYASMEDYVNKKIKLPDNVKQLTEAEVKTEGTTTATWDLTKVTAVEITEEDGTTKNIIPLPKGFQISLEDGENTISEGLVITDGKNEFVWIPISATATFSNPYTTSSYSEPTTLTYDTQTNLTSYYGTKADETNYYTIVDSDEYRNNAQNTFAYNAHYAEMKLSVEKYDGFYIGRYETTIDESGNIGSKVAATVLTSDITLRTIDNTSYPYRWWGLYEMQRKANVKGNGSVVQTNMIWGQQWDAMISYFDNATPKIDYEATTDLRLATSEKQASGQAKYTKGNLTISDEIYNIYDLSGNVYDWTAEAYDTLSRVTRGGCYEGSFSASYRMGGSGPYDSSDHLGSRLTLYIK